jgi:hypothetical protein
VAASQDALVHPPGCRHTLYNVGARNHYISLPNLNSCLSAEFHWYKSKSTLTTIWVHHKMHYVHPPGCGHILYGVGVNNHYESLANFISCLSAEFHWYWSKSTLRTMWLHHKMHFVHPPGCGHTVYTVRGRNHHKSFVNLVSCLLAELYWYRSKSSLRTMQLHHKMHFVHPPGCGHTLYAVGGRNHHKSLANLVSCLLAECHWYRSKSNLRTMRLHQKMHFVHPPGCGHTLHRPLQ